MLYINPVDKLTKRALPLGLPSQLLHCLHGPARKKQSRSPSAARMNY